MTDRTLDALWQALLNNPLAWGMIVLALIAGWLCAWLISRRKQQQQQQLLEQQSLEQVRLQSGIEQARRELEQQQQQFEQLQHNLETKIQQLSELRESHASMVATLNAEREHNQQQVQRLEAAEQRLGDTFKRLAADIFEQKNKTFNQQSREQMTQVLGPLQTQMQNFATLVQTTNEKNAQQHGHLQKQLLDLESLNKNLSSEAAQLTDALRGSNKMMGNWGEQQLEKLLQLAGLQKDREYQLQVSVKNHQQQTLRPDALIMLPDEKCIVIDAKVSLEHYTRAYAAENDAESDRWLGEHCQSIKQHINSLSSKGYAHIAELDTPNFVLMFVPVEAALLEALRFDSSLLDYAISRNVALVTPTNLLSTLRTVGSVWQAWRQNENAREIADRAGKLYDKFSGFVTDLENLGQRLTQARKAYDDAFGKLSTGSGNLLRQVQMLQDLGAKTGRSLPAKYLQDELEEANDADSERNEPGLPPALTEDE